MSLSGRSRQPRRAQRPERVVFILGLVGMAILSSAYFVASSVGRRVTPLSSSAAATAPKVAAISARRTPINLSTITRVGSFQRALDAFAPQIPSQSCLQVDWLGTTMKAIGQENSPIPASTTKIVTAAVALEVLSPTYTFKTVVKTNGVPQTGSIDNLYVIGGGDPIIARTEYIASEKYSTIHATALEKIVDAIVASGVRTITGAIIVDDSRYDSNRFVDIWPDSFHFTEAGPLGALMVNDGVIVGNPVKPDDPALAAAAEIGALLAMRGITVALPPRRDIIPAEAGDIATIESAPLTNIVNEMLVNSDNNTAELLVKELGFVKKQQGTTAAGLAVIQETLAAWKLSDSVVINDGSGLSATNQVPCSIFNRLLTKEVEQLPQLLPIAGTSGTLRDMFEDSAMSNRLLGKTGTLSGVKALAGYVPVDASEPVVFSLVLNKSSIDNKSAYRPIWNAFAVALSKARSQPQADQLAP